MPKVGYSPLTGSVVLDELVAEIGWDAMLAVSRHFGGQQLDVPLRCPDDHKIVAALGREVADTLCSYHGNTSLEIPISFRREAEIRYLASLEPKLKVNEIAARCFTHRRTVMKILKQPPRAITLEQRRQYELAQRAPQQLNLLSYED